jgi:hypothetical protein
VRAADPGCAATLAQTPGVLTTRSPCPAPAHPRRGIASLASPPPPPPQVLIGPIGPRAARPDLEPPAVADFVAFAPAGVAVVSFGSMPVFGNFLDKEDFRALSAALASLAPARALWLLQVRGSGGAGRRLLWPVRRRPTLLPGCH